MILFFPKIATFPLLCQNGAEEDDFDKKHFVGEVMWGAAIFLVCLSQVLGFPTYPGSCLSVVGDTTGVHSQNSQTGANLFTITVPTAYTVAGAANTITLTSAQSFTGFLLWAEDATGVRQGSFMAQGNTQTGATFASKTINPTVCNNANGDPAGMYFENVFHSKLKGTLGYYFENFLLLLACLDFFQI